MADAAGRITKLEVRCACGTSCENAEAYFRHKSLCGTHQKKKFLHTTPSSKPSSTLGPARASISDSYPETVACWCGRTFKNRRSLRQHGYYCAVYKQQTNANSTPSDPARVLELNSNPNTAPAPEKSYNPTAQFAAKKIQCPCGQSFANEKALSRHQRYSKTHQVGRPGYASTSKGKTSNPVPFIIPQSIRTPIHPASGPVPDTTPSSVPPAAHEQWDDVLVTSFASLNLGSMQPQLMPPVAGFSCVCGSIFIDRKALEHHKQDARLHARQVTGERREKKFTLSRPQYQKEEELHDMAAVYAQQYESRE
ncbi:unnamed protein product [Periconia digitata]|uniref:C2H2-type domain-containing protein n=1 Tax=Periconia digitata TaxID=1303443 RepID=A0A9W4UAB4_9PLEO|nr:unnamed protein product [Periconia digitata]